MGKAREVQITGETASSSKLIELLEQSTLLQNAAPRGTVTRGSQPGSERFMIAAEARSRPQPEARPVMEMVSVLPAPTNFIPMNPFSASSIFCRARCSYSHLNSSSCPYSWAKRSGGGSLPGPPGTRIAVYPESVTSPRPSIVSVCVAESQLP